MTKEGNSGTHTWDLYLHYQKCPQCEFIFESREPFTEVRKKGEETKLTKSLTCPQCHHAWTEEKPASKKWHLFPGYIKPEFDWE